LKSIQPFRATDVRRLGAPASHRGDRMGKVKVEFYQKAS
jgi:hypothetical protein